MGGGSGNERVYPIAVDGHVVYLGARCYFNNGKLRITNGPESIGKNYVYRNGTHEQSTRYHFSEETNEIGKGGKLQHFHYEEIKPYAYTYNKQMYRGIFKCNHSIVYQPK